MSLYAKPAAAGQGCHVMLHDDASSGKCPFCGSNVLLDGVIGGCDAYAYFQPSGLKLVGRLLASVHFQSQHQARACRDCGHVWAQIEAGELSKLWEQWRRASEP